MYLIKDIPHYDRPRERLKRCGTNSLSDNELLSIILGSGSKGNDVMKVASQVLTVIDQNWSKLTIEKLNSIAGIGEAKASLLLAALEFARRRIKPSGYKIASYTDAIPLLQHLADRKQEHFVCISLNGAHEVICTRVVTIGLVNSTQIHPREVFCDPLIDRASAIIIAHNHPSGNNYPSKEDLHVTKLLIKAGEILGIKVLDHIIFSITGSYSLLENGQI